MLVGLGVGVASVTVPVYIAELAPPRLRARLVSLNVLAITGGQFAAYLVNWGAAHLPGNWRWMLGVAALPPLVQLAGLALAPATPPRKRGEGTRWRQLVRPAVLRQLHIGGVVWLWRWSAQGMGLLRARGTVERVQRWQGMAGRASAVAWAPFWTSCGAPFSFWQVSVCRSCSSCVALTPSCARGGGGARVLTGRSQEGVPTQSVHAIYLQTPSPRAICSLCTTPPFQP